jgi:uncharacterized protein
MNSSDGSSILIYSNSTHPLFGLTREDFLEKLKKKLEGKVEEAYIFGSLKTNTLRNDSDIDLILVSKSTLPFVERFREFPEIFDLAPRVDLLIYTPEEFKTLLAENSFGFWKSIKETWERVI